MVLSGCLELSWLWWALTFWSGRCRSSGLADLPRDAQVVEFSLSGFDGSDLGQTQVSAAVVGPTDFS